MALSLYRVGELRYDKTREFALLFPRDSFSSRDPGSKAQRKKAPKTRLDQFHITRQRPASSSAAIASCSSTAGSTARAARATRGGR